MKNLKPFIAAVAAVILAAYSPLSAQETPPPASADPFSPPAVLSAMQRVADWQLAHPSPHKLTDWTQGAGDAGFMALAGISGDTKYRDAMLAMGATNRWQPGSRKFHADDHCVGQTYCELYFLYRDPRMIAPMRERFDAILSQPSTVTKLDFTQPHGVAGELWSWCDALFMAPPAWLRLYRATGDERYLNFAVTNWWRTSDYLYDREEHLFFRDSTYFHKTEANGKKVFWSRGNGWVMAGLVRMLQYLPANHPDYARFEQQFKDMAGKILSVQQPDGLWRASLLDPASYPLKETSGSGFFTYALAWGVNQGLLDRATYEPAVRRAWTALVSCVDADGKLTHVQPIGADPKKFAEDATEVYGVGAFLLAGNEIYRMAVLEKATTLEESQSKPAVINGLFIETKQKIEIKVTNPADFYRESETVELNGNDLSAKSFFSTQMAVMDGLSSRIVSFQYYVTPEGQDKLVFQVDLAPHETRSFYLIQSPLLAAGPQPIVKTFARYVPERFDDFAWESDRIAHRTYGQGLIKGEGTISSGPDVWIKKNRGLVVNIMYAGKHYHDDNGEFMDDYRVGSSRGDGGVGIWDGKKLYVSSNWKTYRLITTGPIRSEFELTYDAWDIGGGRKVSETKRYRIDAGSWFTRAQSTFHSDDPSPLTIGIGLAQRSAGPGGTQIIGTDQTLGWMTYWQPEDKPKGTIATAIVLPRNSVSEFTTDAQDMPAAKLREAVPSPTVEGAPALRNLLAITRVEIGQPFTYYFGASWDRSGDFTTPAQWNAYVNRFAERRDQPLKITLGNLK